MSHLDRTIASLLALIFGFAGIDKLVHLQGFVNALDDFVFLPLPLGAWLAPVVIAAELTIAVGLVRLPWRRGAALHAACLLTLFSIALVANATLGGRGICGCWFSITLARGQLHLFFNLLLIGLSLLLWISMRRDEREQKGPVQNEAAASRPQGLQSPTGEPEHRGSRTGWPS